MRVRYSVDPILETSHLIGSGALVLMLQEVCVIVSKMGRICYTLVVTVSLRDALSAATPVT